MAVFTATEALEIALNIEKNGQTFYAAAARNMDDPEVKRLLESLAEWEVQHYQTFEQLLKQVDEPLSLAGDQWNEYDQYLEATLDNALFRGPDKALAAAEGVASGQEALQMALGFEKDALLFYHDLREMLREKERDIVDRIIAEEKSHVRKLAALLRTGSTEL